MGSDQTLSVEEENEGRGEASLAQLNTEFMRSNRQVNSGMENQNEQVENK